MALREIIFRGKRIDNGDWVYGDYASSGCGIVCMEYLNEHGDAGEVFHPVDLKAIGQFTGLTAKGKKIFEGDIVKGLFLFGMEIKAVVAFQDGAFGLQWNRGSVKEFSAFTSICNVKYEIVGNIHDNPELMEG